MIYNGTYVNSSRKIIREDRLECKKPKEAHNSTLWCEINRGLSNYASIILIWDQHYLNQFPAKKPIILSNEFDHLKPRQTIKSLSHIQKIAFSRE